METPVPPSGFRYVKNDEIDNLLDVIDNLPKPERGPGFSRLNNKYVELETMPLKLFYWADKEDQPIDISNYTKVFARNTREGFQIDFMNPEDYNIKSINIDDSSDKDANGIEIITELVTPVVGGKRKKRTKKRRSTKKHKTRRHH